MATMPVHRKSGVSPSKSDDSLKVFVPPTFTVKELLGAIPAHCFERSAIRSFSYVVMDLAMITALAFAASHIDASFGAKGSVLNGLSGQIAKAVAWATYIFFQGHVMTGLWVIAHECGHQAFSTSKHLNNAVGWVLHSALLVPYHSWRISHARHHANTGSMTKDEVFIPKTRSRLGLPDESTFEKMDEILEDAPIWTVLNLFAQQLLGWPMYLLRNASGRKYPKFANHFNPDSPIFDARHRKQILWSDLGLGITFTALYFWAQARGFREVGLYYLLPYLVVNHDLVMITFLQHTDPNLPHYREGEWNFQRGALCTVDRNFMGWFGAFVWHGICETHVAHHISSRIPHYNAWEATEALKNLLGTYYVKSDENMYVSLYKNYRDCKFVEDEGDCVFYKNKQGKATTKAVFDCTSDSGVDVQ